MRKESGKALSLSEVIRDPIMIASKVFWASDWIMNYSCLHKLAMRSSNSKSVKALLSDFDFAYNRIS